MNSTRAASFIAILSLVSPLASQVQSPDLKVLQVQYENLVSERVTEVYNAAMSRLEAGYLAGVERGLAEAKAAGDLPTALALQEEIKRLASKGALPDDDGQAVAPLKSLRAIYRAELPKLDAQRTSNRAALLAPYIGRLQKLESDLTKASRLTEAKAVMDYRKEIAASVPATPSATSTEPSTPPTPAGVKVPSAPLPIGVRLAESMKIYSSGCDGCTIMINGKVLMKVGREAPSVISRRLREGDVIAVNVMNSRFDINSFWLSCIASTGEFLFESSEQWTGYVPGNEAKWWIIKDPKEQKPVGFAPDKQEYVDRVKHSASQTPLYTGTQPIRSMVKNDVGATWVYYVVNKADLVPKQDRKVQPK